MTDSLTIPHEAGRAIVEDAAMIACPLLGTDRFLQFCTDRGIQIDRERLIRLERLAIFAPVFRVRKPRMPTAPFRIPPSKGSNWFIERWACDTTAVPQRHEVPTHTDQTREGYYSIFQVDYLHLLLTDLTLHVPLDAFLDRPDGKSIDWCKVGDQWMRSADSSATGLRDHEHRRAVALLCQHISNRYFPQTQTDMRTMEIHSGNFSDAWISVRSLNWDWDREVHRWDPRKIETLYSLTPKKLRHAYRGLALIQASFDPIKHWYQLVQFISVHERRELKGDALRAETLRNGAQMLRLLHRDLYGDDLPHPNEVSQTIIGHVPELDVREDTRRYLEFVANRFGVNPQPRLSLIVEGQSEEAAVTRLFKEYFGAHSGTYGIEIIPLGGVGAATGKKKEDRFRAIVRLVDYLHHHQTFAFLILDNENYASRLKNEMRKAKSIHGDRRYVTRPEYIKIWRNSFEFDNFSCTEIAAALTKLAQDSAMFDVREVAYAKRAPNSGAALQDLFRTKTNYGINKIRLAEILVDIMMSRQSRRKIENRPIVRTLERVERLAVRNHLPATQRVRDSNQVSRFLGRRRR